MSHIFNLTFFDEIGHFIAEPLFPATMNCMTTHERVESLIRQVADLPADAQAELFQSLIELRAQHLGIYDFDGPEREAQARSAEDIRQGNFASDQEVEATFSRDRA